MKNIKNVVLFFLGIFCFTNGSAQQNPDIISLEHYSGNQRVIAATVEGIPCHFLFDTGKGSTVLSPDLANRLNMQANGTYTSFNQEGVIVNSKSGTPVNITIGNTGLFQKQVLIADINFPLTKNRPQVDGILSLKSFEDKIITIDFSKNQLIIETNESFQERKNALILLESVFATGISGQEMNVFVSVEIKKKKLWMKFDSGNSDRVLLSKNAASILGLFPDSVLNAKDYIPAGNIAYAIQPSIVENLGSAVKNMIYDGAFDYSFISGSSYTLDLKQKLIYLEPY
jgi:hypothetical protein